MPKRLLSVNASGNSSMSGSFKTWRPQTVAAYPLVRNVESARGNAQNRPSSSALCPTGSRSYPSTARTSITLPISAVGLPCSSSRRNRSDTSASSATSSWVSLRSLRWARTKLPSASMSTCLVPSLTVCCYGTFAPNLFLQAVRLAQNSAFRCVRSDLEARALNFRSARSVRRGQARRVVSAAYTQRSAYLRTGLAQRRVAKVTALHLTAGIRVEGCAQGCRHVAHTACRRRGTDALGAVLQGWQADTLPGRSHGEEGRGHHGVAIGAHVFRRALNSLPSNRPDGIGAELVPLSWGQLGVSSRRGQCCDE